jgi:FemAB-related protein (PEP-CTERM system-associated)
MPTERDVLNATAPVVRVEAGGAVDGTAWDAYVSQHAEATAFHLAGWPQVVADCFGHRTFGLTAWQGGALTGVLPLVLMASRVFGRFLVSLPFFDYGGVLADNAETERALVAQAVVLAGEAGAAHLELRHVRARDLGLQSRTHRVSMRLPLPADPEALWQGFKGKLRSQIRRPGKEGCVARIAGPEALESFYRVFAVNMRDLGTPVYPKAFFARMLAAMPDRTRLCVVERGGEPVAAAFLVSFRGQLSVQWASALRRYNALSPNMLLYWTVLEHACRSGHQVFDFGRSTPGSGTYRFKEQWGASPQPLSWDYWLPAGGALPDLNYANPKYAVAIRLWQRLPVAVANVLGPRIIKHVPA